MKRGFTLIELLVVISIIGLLSSIVITSLTRSKEKARRSKIIETMSSMRTEASLGVGNNGKYIPSIFSSVAEGGLGNMVHYLNDELQIPVSSSQNVTSSEWKVWVDFNDNPTIPPYHGPWYCVDSEGFSGYVPTAPSGGPKCQ